MVLLLILAIGFYLYKTGEWQKLSQKFQVNRTTSESENEARRIIDMRYASGQITTEEYNKIKNLL